MATLGNIWYTYFFLYFHASIHGLMDVATWIMQCHWRVMPNKSLNCPLEEKKSFSHLDWAYVNTLISFRVDLTSSFWWLSNFWRHFRLKSITLEDACNPIIFYQIVKETFYIRTTDNCLCSFSILWGKIGVLCANIK